MVTTIKLILSLFAKVYFKFTEILTNLSGQMLTAGTIQVFIWKDKNQ